MTLKSPPAIHDMSTVKEKNGRVHDEIGTDQTYASSSSGTKATDHRTSVEAIQMKNQALAYVCKGILRSHYPRLLVYFEECTYLL
ncbi:uncharacterized protein LOC132604474 isoform X3 [Lycium barbarum]|uniref:uncharacterized protein LOC132604474 isoform X3 n=1 Tax=Lycium barbarum TaxID=112863 RepID=UPI00293E0351|nr:uncharacterized protein LOC132604474 isoform X3 [Lycium barbarum]